MLVWWATRVECVSALSRVEREAALTEDEAPRLFEDLHHLALRWHIVEPSRRLEQTATRLLRTHPLRAADSLQLAAALIASEENPASLEFVSRDQRLRSAAAREGLTLL